MTGLCLRIAGDEYSEAMMENKLSRRIKDWSRLETGFRIFAGL